MGRVLARANLELSTWLGQTKGGDAMRCDAPPRHGQGVSASAREEQQQQQAGRQVTAMMLSRRGEGFCVSGQGSRGVKQSRGEGGMTSEGERESK